MGNPIASGYDTLQERVRTSALTLVGAAEAKRAELMRVEARVRNCIFEIEMDDGLILVGGLGIWKSAWRD